MDKPDKTQAVDLEPIRRLRVRVGGAIPGLIVLAGSDIGKVYYIDDEGKTLGRDPEVHIPILDRLVSRRHAQVYKQKAEDSDELQYILVDLHSTNGTFVNGERISKAFLHEGDKIQVGHTTLKFTLHDETDHNYQQEIQRRINFDDLTGLLTLNHFYDRLDRQLKQAQRNKSKVSVLMMDLDGLKDINELHGHLAGSYTIQSVAGVLREQMSDLGEIGRYGGDEFVAFVPELGTDELIERLETLRRAIEDRQFSFKGQPVRITLSIGIATYPWDGTTPEALVAASDAALFQAKEKGKNRIVLHAHE